MNNTPPSADLNKLRNILGNAKNLINNDVRTTNTHNSNGPLPSPRQMEQMQQQQMQQPQYQQRQPERGGYGPGGDVQYLSEADMLRAQGGQMQMQQHTMGNPTRKPGHISEEAIRNSNLPESVKQAYLDNPIKQPASINHSFNLDDVSDLIEPPQQFRQQSQQPRQRMNESVIQNANDSFTVSETALRGIIKDVLVEYLAADYTKNLTEATIKKTINTLIKEGKIKTKPKR